MARLVRPLGTFSVTASARCFPQFGDRRVSRHGTLRTLDRRILRAPTSFLIGDYLQRMCSADCTFLDTTSCARCARFVYALVQTVARERLEDPAGAKGNGRRQDRPRQHAPRGNAGLHKGWRGTTGANCGTRDSLCAAPTLASRRAVYATVRCATPKCDQAGSQ